MYNVLAKLRSGEPLNAKEKTIHELGLVSVLKTLHDELDAAVLEAYGWDDLIPQLATEAGRATLSEVLLTRLVALSAERSRAEANGLVRWLRPEYQNPQKPGLQKTAQAAADAQSEALANAPEAVLAPRQRKPASPAAAEESESTVASPQHEEVQGDARIRRWRRIEAA